MFFFLRLKLASSFEEFRSHSMIPLLLPSNQLQTALFIHLKRAFSVLFILDLLISIINSEISAIKQHHFEVFLSPCIVCHILHRFKVLTFSVIILSLEVNPVVKSVEIISHFFNIALLLR